MSEFDKLQALLDPPKDREQASVTPRRPEIDSECGSQDPDALRSPAARRRRLLWPLAILLVITVIDAVYLLAKALVAVPR
jgi:hypothetical protein